MSFKLLKIVTICVQKTRLPFLDAVTKVNTNESTKNLANLIREVTANNKTTLYYNDDTKGFDSVGGTDM